MQTNQQQALLRRNPRPHLGWFGARRIAGAGALLGALVLAACETLLGAPPVITCPAAYVVADAARVTQYREGSGTDLTDIRYAAAIIGINWACSYDEDGTLDVEIAIDFSASRGPAADDATGRFSYFVALADPNREILAKQEFKIEVAFEGNTSRVGFRRIAGATFVVGDPAIGSAHQLYIGFQLDEKQLEDNRR